ncbi:Nonsense-mediated mRNA decay protein [Phaffia rhodozyma]|uniref:Nonsense-mediated mRNA decay protein n=1 Tax=Phaffia rhodozyma TaxID=264483 RepID=A0A0F7SL84_PHARH|nr:Nonsense-mediated mRNA decay protein [Phaffia rhodozyma]
MDVTVDRLNLVLKSLNTTLTKELNVKAPWDADIESQRLTIRGNYVRILLKFPDQADPRHLEALWIQTTHAFITRYRARISTPSQPSRSASSNNKKNRRDIQYEKNRNLNRFATFLREEIKFYKAFIGRIASAYELESTEKFLEGFSNENRSAKSLDGIVPLKEAKSKGGAMVVRGFIFLGDLERYGEIYAVGKDSATKESGGQGKAIKQWLGTFEKQSEGFVKAKAMYQIAHLLDPDSGNPFNQLAVVATNQQDISGASYLYLRALAVKGFFPTANENLQRILRRPMDHFWNRLEEVSHRFYHWDSTTLLSFTEDFIVLIGLFVVNPNKFGASVTYSTWFIAEYEYLLGRQLLSTEIILRTFVSLASVHWSKRMTRRVPRLEKESPHSTAQSELAILDIILDIIIVTLDIVVNDLIECLDPVKLARYHNRKERILPEELDARSKETLNSKATVDSMDQFSSYLTVILRRSLPTLRVISKWIRSHQSYLSGISQNQSILASTSDEPLRQQVSGKPPSCAQDTHRSQEKIQGTYRAYADLLNVLNITFPSTEIVSIDVSLEEDFEMRGFGPTHKLMGFQFHRTGDMERQTLGSRGGHPNREYLMRVSDLQKDGTYATKGDTSDLFIIKYGRYAYPRIKTSKLKKSKVEDRLPSNINTLHDEITREAWIGGRAGNVSFDRTDLEKPSRIHADPQNVKSADHTPEYDMVPPAIQAESLSTPDRSPKPIRHQGLSKEKPFSQNIRRTHPPKDVSESSVPLPNTRSTEEETVGSFSKPRASASETSLSIQTPLESPVSIVDLNTFPDKHSAFRHSQKHPVSPPTLPSASDIKAADLAASLQNSLLLRPETPVQDEESASVSTGTEDDPVNRAMRATLDDESEVDMNEMERIREEGRYNEEIELSAWSSSNTAAAPAEIINQGHNLSPSINPTSSPNVAPSGKLTALDLLNQITSSSGLPLASPLGGMGTPSPLHRPQSNLRYSHSMERKESIWAPDKEDSPMGRDVITPSSGLGWSKPGETTWDSPGSISKSSFGTPIGKRSPSGHPGLGGYEQSPYGSNQSANFSHHFSSPHPETFGRSTQKSPLSAQRSSLAEVGRSPTDQLYGHFGGQRDRLYSLPNLEAGALPHSAYQQPRQQQQSPSSSSFSPLSHQTHQTYDPSPPIGLMIPSYSSSPSRSRQPSHPSPLGNMFTDQASPSSLPSYSSGVSLPSGPTADRAAYNLGAYGDHPSSSHHWGQPAPVLGTLLQPQQQQQRQSNLSAVEHAAGFSQQQQEDASQTGLGRIGPGSEFGIGAGPGMGYERPGNMWN